MAAIEQVNLATLTRSEDKSRFQYKNVHITPFMLPDAAYQLCVVMVFPPASLWRAPVMHSRLPNFIGQGVNQVDWTKHQKIVPNCSTHPCSDKGFEIFHIVYRQQDMGNGFNNQRF